MRAFSLRYGENNERHARSVEVTGEIKKALSQSNKIFVVMQDLTLFPAPAERALGSGWDSGPAVNVGTQGTTEAIQGHRLRLCLDQF